MSLRLRFNAGILAGLALLGLIVVVALFADGLAPHDPLLANPSQRDLGLFTTGLSTQMGPSMRAGLYYMNYVTPTAVAHSGTGSVQVAW